MYTFSASALFCSFAKCGKEYGLKSSLRSNSGTFKDFLGRSILGDGEYCSYFYGFIACVFECGDLDDTPIKRHECAEHAKEREVETERREGFFIQYFVLGLGAAINKS